MSGIVGIVHFDRAPVDRHLLGQMTASMAFRGPDAQEVWVEGNVGFGHALLKTTAESENERQPRTLDGRIWIVADARVDARRDLVPELKAHGHEDLSPDATDVELILRAYLTWGNDCVEHLLGDFAFAIWDAPRRSLFCARDHLGVKPFFYAHLGQRLIFSSSLDCLRQHPGVSDRLNDLAIADFLLFDLNQDLATTSFADIQRLPPAHAATWSAGDMQLRRYWMLPIDEPLYLRESEDYVDRFRELLDQAVSDRLRTPKIGVMMSGGLDSPTLAATASKLLRAHSADGEVRAFTSVLDGVMDNNERYYANLVAEYLGIPIQFRDLGGKMFDPTWAEAAVHTAEPTANPLNLVCDRQQYQAMAGTSRVWFYGEGPDNALRLEWQPYLAYLMGRRHFGRLAKNVWHLVVRSRRIPFLSRLVRPLQARWSGQSELSIFPGWIKQDFVERLHLRQRWEDMQRSAPLCPHPLRPEAYRSFESPLWERLFSQYDAEAVGTAAEFRHPFVDLRLLRYMLAVPAVPWAREKYLVRRAMRGVLPTPVLRRHKSPLTGDPYWQGARRLGLAPLLPALRLEEYVDFTRVPDRADQDMMTFWADLRARTLNYWLRNMQIKSSDLEDKELLNKFSAKRDGGRNSKILRAVS
jgi:asparagine synthase (glutamine-hydrolysing)